MFVTVSGTPLRKRDEIMSLCQGSLFNANEMSRGSLWDQTILSSCFMMENMPGRSRTLSSVKTSVLTHLWRDRCSLAKEKEGSKEKNKDNIEKKKKRDPKSWAFNEDKLEISEKTCNRAATVVCRKVDGHTELLAGLIWLGLVQETAHRMTF